MNTGRILNAADMSQTAEPKQKSSRNRGASVCRDYSMKQHVITVEHKAGGKNQKLSISADQRPSAQRKAIDSDENTRFTN